MRFPDFLPAGGRIGCIAPSFGCTTEPYATLFHAAEEFFSAEGFSIVEGPNCRAAEGLGKSNTPEKCGAEINDFFLNDRCDVILSCGGGETMCEDLPYVDFRAIAKAKPRWYMGFSDNTNLTFLLPTLADTAAVYGPNMPAFGMESLHESVLDAWALLKGEKLTLKSYPFWEKESLRDETNPRIGFHLTESSRIGVFPGMQGETGAEGRLLGGCLDVLQCLCGTPYDKVRAFNKRYRENGVLWFLEACDLNPMGIRRALWQLREAGWFAEARGFLIGRPMHFEEDVCGVNRINAVTDMLGRLGVPLFTDLDIGHLPPMMPLIAGAVAEAGMKNGVFTVTMHTDR